MSLLFAEQNRLDFLLTQLKTVGPTNYAMIIAHRGDWRFAPENSLKAIENCIKSGFDAVEVDVQKTKDGVLVVIHDETINRTTNGKGKVSDFTLEELKQFRLKTPTNFVSKESIPTLDEVLELTRDKILVYIDKWKNYKEEVLSTVHRLGVDRQILLIGSANVNSQDYKMVREYPDINYIPQFGCNGKDDEKRFESTRKLMEVDGYYLVFRDAQFPLLDKTYRYSSIGHRLWVDTLYGTNFNAGKNDELALDDENTSYGWLWDHGFSVFFTDDPHRVDNYFKSKNLR